MKNFYHIRDWWNLLLTSGVALELSYNCYSVGKITLGCHLDGVIYGDHRGQLNWIKKLYDWTTQGNKCGQRSGWQFILPNKRYLFLMAKEYAVFTETKKNSVIINTAKREEDIPISNTFLHTYIYQVNIFLSYSFMYWLSATSWRRCCVNCYGHIPHDITAWTLCNTINRDWLDKRVKQV